MHYYIDGYNLLFRMLKPEDDLKTQRQRIIKELEVKINLLELDTTIVFDSQYQLEEESNSHLRGLEIIFTASGETADDFILKKINESLNPSQHTVITSDKKLALSCQKRLAKTEYVETFMSMLNRRYKNKLLGIKPDRKKKSNLRVRKEITSQAEVISLRTLKAPSVKAAKKKMTKPPSETKGPLEGCFDYYLEVFQKKFLKGTSLPKCISKKKPAQSPKEEASISDMQRWLKAFEKKFHDSKD